MVGLQKIKDNYTSTGIQQKGSKKAPQQSFTGYTDGQ